MVGMAQLTGNEHVATSGGEKRRPKKFVRPISGNKSSISGS
jgi:hypothetical protein